MPLEKSDRNRVFVSYSRNDVKWLKRLKIHLKDLERGSSVELWDDTKIQAGADWRKEISEALDSARVAVLLVSADFIASDFIAENELPPLLAAAENNGVTILPLILSPSRFENIESLARFQSINPPSKPLIGLPKVEQEKYLVKISEAVLNVMKKQAEGSAGTVRRESRKIFKLPVSRNKYFTGREKILTQLHEGFFTNGDTAQALVGLGGVGKTQTAARYAYEYRKEYQNIFWTTARSEETLIPSYLKIACSLGLRETRSRDQNEAIGAAKLWIENHSGWLLVLDHAEDQSVFRNYIPSNQDGHVLLTARKQVETENFISNNIDAMSSEEGALFILRKLGKLKLDEMLTTAPPELREKAERLSNILAGVPLALNQAAAYILHEHIDINEYIQTYNAERHDILNDHPESIARTFQMSFQKVSKENSATADMLRICAFLDADAIPEELFIQNKNILGESLGNLAESKSALNRAVGAGNRYSLLHRDIEKKTNRINRLVQDVICLYMGDNERRLWAGRAVRAVSNLFPMPEYENWSSCDRLVRHAIVLSRIALEYDIVFPEAALMLNRAGAYLNSRGRLDEAEPLYRRSLDMYEKLHEGESQDAAAVLSNLGLLSQLRGKYGEAEDFFQRSLKTYEKGTAPEDTRVARVINNLAQLYVTLGKYEQAELLYNRSFKIIENHVGSEHPDIALLMNNVAELHHKQGKDREAETGYLNSRRILEKHFGVDNPLIATVLNNLAKHYRVQGRYNEAEPLYKHSLAIYEKALGDNHPDLAIILNNLALLYRSQNRHNDAEGLYHRVLKIHELAETTDRLDFAAALENLASLYQSQGRLIEAEPLYKQSLETYEKCLEPTHTDVIGVRNAYHDLLYDLGR